MMSDTLAAAIESAMAHPFYVVVYTSERMAVAIVGFQREDEARSFASMRPEPVIHLIARRGPTFGQPEVIASRVLTRHPDAPTDFGFRTRDDFPDTRT